jgi:phosphoglycerol transferase MdoB-like AlkP superfamily enzyme
MTTLHLFLNGASTMGFVVAAVFFARFWDETRDRLFAIFAVAFAALAANRALLALVALGREAQPYLYVVRLAAFVLIAYAVVDKNRR